MLKVPCSAFGQEAPVVVKDNSPCSGTCAAMLVNLLHADLLRWTFCDSASYRQHIPKSGGLVPQPRWHRNESKGSLDQKLLLLKVLMAAILSMPTDPSAAAGVIQDETKILTTFCTFSLQGKSPFSRVDCLHCCSYQLAAERAMQITLHSKTTVHPIVFFCTA